MARFRPVLRDIDFTEQQWRGFPMVQDTRDIDATQLAHAACVLGLSLTRSLKTLEARQLIRLNRDPADRRRARIAGLLDML